MRLTDHCQKRCVDKERILAEVLPEEGHFGKRTGKEFREESWGSVGGFLLKVKVGWKDGIESQEGAQVT